MRWDRKYYDSDLIEVTWQVGPLEDGKEVVMVYQTNMNTPDFYTDANGRQMIKRVLNEEGWKALLLFVIDKNHKRICKNEKKIHLENVCSSPGICR